MSNIYDERVLQEIGWGNYSEVKKITSLVLRKEPKNDAYIYIRDYIEHHKSSNGRYEKLKLNQYLQYIVDNIEVFYKEKDLTLFVKCLYKDIINIDDFREIVSVNIENIDMIINRLEHLKSIQDTLQNISSEVLCLYLEEFYKIKNQYEEYLEKEKEKKIALMKERRIQEEKERNEKKKKITIAVICVVIFLIILLIKGIG